MRRPVLKLRERVSGRLIRNGLLMRGPLMRGLLMRGLLMCGLLLGSTVCTVAQQPVSQQPFPLSAKRILFVGDSITHNGRYVSWIETQLRLQGVTPLPEIINIGLGSETCSGLSEPDHPFPRPDIHERLERALVQIKPDVVVACYGMNDGIYYPFGEKRFAAYKRGIGRLIDKVQASGAQVILLTPPPFDPLPLRDKGKLKPLGESKYAYFAMYEDYDDVLSRYGKWIMQQNQRVALVVDVHTPLAQHVAEHRRTTPAYTLSPDGIHPNADGHRLLGRTILQAWGVESQAEPDAKLESLVHQRMVVLHDAWLSAVGHKRPGVKAGLPLPAANRRAAELESRIQALVTQARKPVTATRAATGGRVFQVSYPATAMPGELRLSVTYYLWIPTGVQKLRGIIVHQHGCGPGASLGGQTAADDLHWQALARKWDCCLMGSTYEPRRGVNCRLWCDARRGSERRFLQALSEFAGHSGHPEVTTVPWCLWGHSGGGFWASLMQVSQPQRIVAIWLRSGTAFGYWSQGDIEPPTIPDPAYQVPVLGNPGLKEKTHDRFHKAWDGLLAMQKAYRKQGAWFQFAPDPRTAHECGDSRYLAIPYFDFWLDHRLPPADGNSTALRPVAAARAAWDETMAAKLDEYVRSGAVSDSTPPPPPTRVWTQRNTDGSVTVDWNAVADLESGIRCFVVERDGKRIAQVPPKPRGRFGRPLFQSMSYHDTPERPLPVMRFRDESPSRSQMPVYRVRTVNGVELVSPPTSSR